MSTPKQMNPERFVIGERVLYVNHVTDENLGLLEVVKLDTDTVVARKFFGGKKFTFQANGCATWSSNLSIQKLDTKPRDWRKTLRRIR